MQAQLAILALLSLVAGSSACFSCYSPCYWCGGGGGYNYFPTYRPSFPYYGGGGGGSSSAAASASASSSGGGGGGFGGYPYGGGGGASAAAAAAAAAGGGAAAASAAASAAGGGGGGGYPYQQFSPYWGGGQYWDVDSDAAAQVKDKKSACAVLIEQYVDEPVLANDLVHVVNETFFAGNAAKIQNARHKQRNFTLDATPSTFHCCHVLYGNELLKKDGIVDDSLVEKNTTADHVNDQQRRARHLNNVRAKTNLRQKVPPQIYALPILPANTTCASLTDTLFEGLKAQLKGGNVETTTATTESLVKRNDEKIIKKRQ